MTSLQRALYAAFETSQASPMPYALCPMTALQRALYAAFETSLASPMPYALCPMPYDRVAAGALRRLLDLAGEPYCSSTQSTCFTSPQSTCFTRTKERILTRSTPPWRSRSMRRLVYEAP